jgi:hypothetical protein
LRLAVLPLAIGSDVLPMSGEDNTSING